MQRNVIALCAVGVMSMSFGQAIAQSDWPSKPVKFISGSPPGSPGDILLRAFCEGLTRISGQACVADSRAGTNGIPGIMAFLNAPRDTHTLTMLTINSVGINPHLYKSLPYDPIRDFTPLGFFVDRTPFYVAVTDKVSARTLSDLIGLAKAQPGKLSYASTTAITGLIGEWIKKAAGIDMVQINYNTAGQLTQAALAGDVQVVFQSLPTIRSAVDSGKLILVAVTGTKRSPAYPNVQALNETIPGFYPSNGWLAAFGHAGLSKDVALQINRVIDKVVTERQFRDRMSSSFSWENVEGASTPEALADAVKLEYQLWKKMIQDIGVTPQ